MKIKLRNKTGMIKERKVGFSWTTLFFGFFPALFRGDWKWAVIIFLVSILTSGASNFVFCFIYNRIHINDLLTQGYGPATKKSQAILISKGFIAENYAANFAG
ncbi:hypothetical protein [Paenibacillus peoriae]|uniref:hypothetical protein n=1 Tax=Paenibacillus peoriae TaxID=59893 RepID=UPI00215A6B1F|nr:hypothetical protein [Paenibacillus peoriae]